MKTRVTVLFALLAGSVSWAQTVPEIDPSLESQLTFYKGDNMYPAIGADSAPTWSECLPDDGKRAIVKLTNGKLDPNCMPDTVYSWQGEKRIKDFTTNFSGDKWKDFKHHVLYTTFNPVATFGYGREALRIKLKPDTTFVLVSDKDFQGHPCEVLSDAQAQNTLVVRHDVSITDFILCTPGPIESWSLGTRRHHDEVVSSTLWYFKEAPTRDWLPYRLLYEAVKNPSEGVAPLFISEDPAENGRKFDGHEFSQRELMINMLFFKSYADKNKGQIHYRPGTPKDEARHFRTRRPILWNTQID